MMTRVRYETAVRRLNTIADRCQQASAVWGDRPLLVGTYAFGAVLDAPAELPAVDVAFVLDLPADELTWGVEPQSLAGLPALLEIDKAPVRWYWRPAVWPVSNHLIVRPVRIWSLDGPDTTALQALANRTVEQLRPPAAAPQDLAQQLADERAASLTHLRHVHANYWERNWRSGNRGNGLYPEHHLWNAVHGYLDLLDAAAEQPR
jgi:hypothetical protein